MGRTHDSLVAAGFTLVELMVVVIIMGLIGGIAVTSWVAMLPNQQFNSAVRNLSEVLYETRSMAISQNREYRIQYDLDRDTYRVRTPFKPGGGFATTEDEADHLWSNETDLKESGIDLLEITIDDQSTKRRQGRGVLPAPEAPHHVVQLRWALFGRDFTLQVLPRTGIHADGLFTREPSTRTSGENGNSGSGAACFTRGVAVTL
jgi:prepilin-type N-terminal cleavage/methylation domain-containing protein